MTRQGGDADVDPVRRFSLTTAAVAAVALAHALLTWPLPDAAVLFVGGGALAFVAEALVVRLGMLRHAMAPRVAGVPLVVVAAWPATVYVLYRLALLVAPAGLRAAALAAVVGVLLDLLTDPDGVERGVWTYPEHWASAPRFRGVPWWNFVGWLALVFLTAMLPTLLG